MGHYRSEMVSEAEQDREETARRERFERSRKKIQEAIDKNGMASVLAEMVQYPLMFRIQYG